MKRIPPALAAALAALGSVSAGAAELPTTKHTREAPPHQSCTIGGMRGYLIPGTQTCLKISGYISGGVETRH